MNHILRRHPAIIKPDITHALTAPVRICDHKTELMQRVWDYEGALRSTGFFRSGFQSVVVELIDERRGEWLQPTILKSIVMALSSITNAYEYLTILSYV